MPRGLLTMSLHELDRVTVIQQIIEKHVKQRDAKRLLNLSSRQVIRLVKAYRREGAQGLLSKQRGCISHRKYSEEKKTKVKDLVEKHYRDFGPTFAAEKLEEDHSLVVSKETLRQWMIEWRLWKAKRSKQRRIHQSRARRDCLGELIQIDGSPHDWFEGRGPSCCLLVFIDDATSQLMGLRFDATETRVGYFKLARDYLEKHGLPLAFYSDKYSVFRVNQPDVQGEGETQFGRMCRTLGIELICAHSPQAKGRVERVNNTLQNRLVKELRLAGINDIEAGNAFLPTYIEAHNRRFAVIARNQINAHRQALPPKDRLDLLFSFQVERRLSKNLELSYKNVIYQVKTSLRGYRLQGATVTVCEDVEGQVRLLYQGKVLSYNCQQKSTRVSPIVNAKQLDKVLDEVIKHDGRSQGTKPKQGHPWRQYELYELTASKAKLTGQPI